MKRKTIKPIIISALMAVSFGATAVGTTFALFTDRADTKIEVTAGVVDIETTVKMVSYSDGNLLNSSPVDLTSKKSYTTEIGTKFELVNGDKDLEITNFVPGDKIELSVALVNKSNVKTKYRLTASNNAGKLAKALKVTATGGATSWTELPAAPAEGKEIETAHVTIEFVNHDEGEILAKEDLAARDNRFMGKTVTYHLGYEVVQGNAHTVDSEPTGFNSYEEVVKPTQDVQGSGYVWEKEVAGGIATLSGKTPYDTPVTVTLGTDVENSNFVFEGGSETVSYDIHVDRNAQDTTAVSVKVLLEKDLAGVTIYHEKDDGTVEEVENTYDPLTGYVTFQTNTFSPYHFVQIPNLENVIYVSNADELTAALANNEGKKIFLKNDIFSTTRFSLTENVELYGMGHEIKVGSILDEQGKETTHGDNRVLDVASQSNKTYKFYDVVITEAQKGAVTSDTYRRGISLYGSQNIDVTFDNVKVSSDYYAINVAGANNNIVININNSSVASGYCSFQSWSPNVTFNLNTSTFEGYNNKSYDAAGWNNFSTVVFNEGATNNKVTFKDCVLVAGYDTFEGGKHNQQTYISFREATGTKVYLTNTAFIYKINGIDVTTEELVEDNIGDFNSWDAIYNSDYVIDGVDILPERPTE